MIRPFIAVLALMALVCPAVAIADSAPSGPNTEPARRQPDRVDEFFSHGPIPRLHIELSPENMDKLRRDPRAYVPATIREEGAGAEPEVVYKNVSIHLKGGAGSYRGVDDKPGLTLNFGRSSPGQAFHGLRKINLNNCAQDPSYLSENLGNAVFRDAGIPAARVTYARVRLNQRELGLFVLKEGFDDVFVNRFFPEPRGTLYEGGFLRDVDGEMPPRVNKAKADPARFKELVAAAREGDPAQRRPRLERVLDADRFLTFMAMEALTAHWDGYCPNRNNYRVYHDPKADKFIFLPHGTDQLFQQPDYPLSHGNALVAQAMVGTPDDKARYLERVIELRQRVFTPERLNKQLDEIDARLRPVVAQIGPDAAREHKDQAEEFRRRVAQRVQSIDRQLAAAPRPLKFDAAGVAALSNATWEQRQAGGRVTLDRTDEAGRARLHIRVDPNGGEGTASFRTTVPLPRGRYTFEGPCRTAGVAAPPGTNTGAGLRISGGQRPNGLSGDAGWQQAGFDFEVTEASRDVVLVCELKATRGEAWFDPAGLKLRRRP